MTAQQIKWASQHDWYVGSYKDDADGYVCAVIERFSDGTSVDLTFNDVHQLAAWAGY